MLVADPEAIKEFEIHPAVRNREASEREEDEKYATYRRSNKSMCMPAIPIVNAVAGNPPLIPVKLDGGPPHIMMKMGNLGNDNLVTPVEALVDTGTGATIGNLRYFQGMVLQKPLHLCRDMYLQGG